jgi:hypothetical protein
MRSKDIISEVPGGQEHQAAQALKKTQGSSRTQFKTKGEYAAKAQQSDNRRVNNRTANQSQDSLSGGSRKLQQKRTEIGNSRRKEKSKQGGVISDLAKDRETFKPGKLISHPNGLFYQLQKNRDYAEVTGVTKNKKTGELMAGPQGPQKPEGGYVVTPDSALGKQLVKLTKDPKAKVDQSLGDKAKDAVTGAVGKVADKLGMSNLAAKTNSDPDASMSQKVGATVGAGIGRAMANVLRRPKGQPAPDKKAMTNMGKLDMKAFQTRIMQPEQPPEQKLKLAQDMVAQLVQMHSRNQDVENYLNTVGPILKQSGLNKTNPTEYQAIVTQARGLRTEAYQYMNKVLEAVGLTWEDLGYKVIISETITDSVILIPIQDIQLSNIKKLAGL